MSRLHCRCRKCRTRRVLPKHPDEYARGRLPSCEVCGARDYHPDKWMNARDTSKTSCTCAGYWFPHRKGSLFCWYRDDGSDRYPGDSDFMDRNMEAA